MGVCKYCGKEFPDKSLGGHVARCKMNPNYEKTCANDRKNLRKGSETSAKNKKSKVVLVKFEQICPKCGKEFEIECSESVYKRGKYKKFCSSKCANSRIHSEETKQKTANSLKEYYKTHDLPIGFCGCKDKNGNYCRYKTYICKYCGKEFTVGDKRNTGGRQYCSNECRKAWIKENVKWGGCRDGSGRGKSGWYKGIYCSSTWELAYVIYCIDHNIPIERCKEKRSYTYKGKVHNYHPDFVTPDGIVEIKGYVTEQWLEKEKQNPDVKTLYKDDMEKYLKYVHDNYTNCLTDLYDDSKPAPVLSKTCWVHKDDINTIINSELLDHYLNEGWIRGRISNKN